MGLVFLPGKREFSVFFALLEPFVMNCVDYVVGQDANGVSTWMSKFAAGGVCQPNVTKFLVGGL